MQDGGIGWARSMAARAARPTSFLSCHRTSMRPPPPEGGTFWFQIFIQAPSPEIWRKTISGGEEVLARKWGGLFWATSFRKKFIGQPRRGTLCPWYRSLYAPHAGGAYDSHHQTAGVAGGTRRRGGGMAARGARPTAEAASDWVRQ